MNKYLKWFLIVLFSGAILVSLSFFGFMFWLASTVPSCGEASEAVSYARSLPRERLTKLYEDMQLFSWKKDLPVGGYYIDGPNYFPEPFSDIKAKKIRPKDGNIMLEGCFDHYVFLHFHGVGNFKEQKPTRTIVLRWGEGPDIGSEKLWTDE